MFRTLLFRNGSPNADPAATNALFASSPAEILGLMELAWANRDPQRKSGALTQPWETVQPPPLVAEVTLRAKFNLPAAQNQIPPVFPPPATFDPLWVYPHAIEAFFLEHTGVVEIFRQVLVHYLHGENLAAPPDRSGVAPTTDINAWLRVTETLFHGQFPPLSALNVVSLSRPSGDLVRRNLYYRMFGAEPPRPPQAGTPVEQLKPAASNRDFFITFERLLAEVWRGIVNADNTSGRRDTDDAAIATLATRLNDTMRDRRLGGNLQREEFYAACVLSWLHMAVAWDSPIVKALKAEADHPADRLARIGDRVGFKAHVHSAAFFQMAPLATMMMEAIERGLFNDPVSAPFFYRKSLVGGPIPNLSDTMTQLITLYMRATGRDIKAAAVTVSQRA